MRFPSGTAECQNGIISKPLSGANAGECVHHKSNPVSAKISAFRVIQERLATIHKGSGDKSSASASN